VSKLKEFHRTPRIKGEEKSPHKTFLMLQSKGKGSVKNSGKSWEMKEGKNMEGAIDSSSLIARDAKGVVE